MCYVLSRKQGQPTPLGSSSNRTRASTQSGKLAQGHMNQAKGKRYAVILRIAASKTCMTVWLVLALSVFYDVWLTQRFKAEKKGCKPGRIWGEIAQKQTPLARKDARMGNWHVKHWGYVIRGLRIYNQKERRWMGAAAGPRQSLTRSKSVPRLLSPINVIVWRTRTVFSLLFVTCLCARGSRRVARQRYYSCGGAGGGWGCWPWGHVWNLETVTAGDTYSLLSKHTVIWQKLQDPR